MTDRDVTFEQFAGDLTIPPFGLKIRFGNHGADTESGVVCLRPRVSGPPVHTHAQQDERFTVVAGTLGILVGAVWRDVRPGESVDIRRGTPHSYRNGSDAVCVFEYRLTPRGRFAQMMHEFARLAADGKMRSTSDLRSLVYMAMVFVRYADEARSIRPPMAVMRGLAWVGLALGFRLPELDEGNAEPGAVADGGGKTAFPAS